MDKKKNTKSTKKEKTKKKSGGGLKIAVIVLVILLLIFAIIIGVFATNGREKEEKEETPPETEEMQDDNINVENESSDQEPEQQEENQPQEQAAYSAGQPWVVDGQWSLTVNSIWVTDQRNEYSEKNPAQVLIVDYTYENLGYVDEDGIMDGLFFDLSSAQIVDSSGFMGYSYPGDTVNYPQETPVGATCQAQTCIGVDNASSEIRFTVSSYDGHSVNHTATFVIPVS